MLHRARMLNRVEHYAIGLDVGGTKIAGGIVSFPTGQCVAQRVIPTHAERDGQAVLNDTVELAHALQAEANAREYALVGVGVGVCELVDLQGNVQSSHAVGWQGLDIKGAFETIAPTVIESDVRAHALAEALFGAGKEYGLFVFVTVGTGISSCLVQHGEPFAGARGNALVLTTGPLSTLCSICGHMTQQVIEDFASGSALAKRYGVLRTPEVLHAVTAGDERALDIVRSAGHVLGSAVGWLTNVLDPEAIIIGGGLGLAGGLYWETLVKSTRSHIWSEETRRLPILQASVGANAGLTGAAAYSWRRFKEGA